MDDFLPTIYFTLIATIALIVFMLVTNFINTLNSQESGNNHFKTCVTPPAPETSCPPCEEEPGVYRFDNVTVIVE